MGLTLVFSLVFHMAPATFRVIKFKKKVSLPLEVLVLNSKLSFVAL
jgi:hypothetical protein